MSNPVVIRYPLDLTGTHPDNRVLGETHGPCYAGNRVFVLSYGPYYSKSLVVRNASTGVPLVAGVDYKAVHTFIEPTLKTGKLVLSMVVIEPSAYNIPLTVDYQVLGGDYSLSTSALENLVQDLNNDDRAVKWGEIIGKPAAFPPTPHLHDIYDVFGWQYVVASLEAIRQALLLGNSGNNDDLYAYVDLKHSQALQALGLVEDDLTDHINNFNNPHNVTKAQLGLGLVGNYGLATPAIARLGLAHDSLMTPWLVRFANEYHTNDLNNPHQVNKAQTGLGNVDNYPTATLIQALAGTDNASFLTPFLARQMIAAFGGGGGPVTPPNTPPEAKWNVSGNTGWIVNESSFDGNNKFTQNVTFTDASVAGSTAIASRAWSATGASITGTQTGTGNTFTIPYTFTKPAPGNSPAPFSQNVSLTVTDSTAPTPLTHTKTQAVQCSLDVQWNYPNLPGAYGLRVNEFNLLPSMAGYGETEPYESRVNKPVGQTHRHNFVCDIEPYFTDFDYDGQFGGEAVRADHTVKWYIRNNYTHSAATYVNNVTAYSVSFYMDVDSTYWKSALGTVTVTNTLTGLSSSSNFIINARTLPDYIAPTADFEYDADESITGLSVTKPAFHDIHFIDRSVSNDVSHPITEVKWNFDQEFMTKVTGTGNTVPGGWLHVQGGSPAQGGTPAINRLPNGTYVFEVTLACKTAVAPWTMVKKTFNLVSNQGSGAPPSFNLNASTFNYNQPGTVTNKYHVSANPGHMASAVRYDWTITSNIGFSWSSAAADAAGEYGAYDHFYFSREYAAAYSPGAQVTFNLTVTNNLGLSTTVSKTVAVTRYM